MPRLPRKYPPLTSRKRLRGENSPSYQARQKLAKIVDNLLSCAREIFETMSDQSRSFKILGLENEVPIRNYPRLSASRIFYLLDEAEHYTHSAFTPFKLINNRIELFVKGVLREKYQLVDHPIVFYHPIFYFLNCEPDAIIIGKKELVLVEVKGVYVRNGERFNEFGRLYQPSKDLKKWTDQLQFSLLVSGIKKGRLIIVEDFNYEIVFDQLIPADPTFFNTNINLFEDFFLSDLLYMNSEFKSVKAAIRKRIKSKIRASFENQVQLNKSALELKFGKVRFLEKHFEQIHAKIIDN